LVLVPVVFFCWLLALAILNNFVAFFKLVPIVFFGIITEGLKSKFFEIAGIKSQQKKLHELIPKAGVTAGTDYIFKPNLKHFSYFSKTEGCVIHRRIRFFFWLTKVYVQIYNIFPVFLLTSS
jgi:hypothetical protein